MPFLHYHKWEEHSRTFARPIDFQHVRELCIDFNNDNMFECQELIERLSLGITTFMFRCTDPDCGALRQEQCLGEVVNGPIPHP